MDKRVVTVLYISPVGERGGAETALLNILKYHDRSRFRPIVCFLKNGPLVKEVTTLGVNAYLVPTTRFRNVENTLEAVRAIRRIVRQEGVDIVFGNMAMGHLYGGLGSLGTGVKRVWFQHGIPSICDAVTWLAALLPAERLYVNSQATRRAQMRFLNRAKSVQLLYYGLDLSLFRSTDAAKRILRGEFCIPDGAPTVAMVARFQRGKGLHVFIEAAAKVRDGYPNARFLVIGDTLFGLEPEYKEELKALVGKLQLSERVILTGFRNDVPVLLNEVDIVVHASIAPEAFGLAVIEPLALGKPVIGSNQGGPAEILTDGETGFLVSTGDAKALAEKILLLLGDEGLRRRLGQNGRAMVLQQFTMQRMIRELEKSYLEVLRWGG